MGNSILLLSLIFGLPFIVDSVNFKFTSFRPGDPENVVYHGDAIPDGAVNFNNVEYIARVGRVTYAEKVPLWNPKTGTFGYMAPEYVIDGRASKESDIYSFGIGILEIVTGKKSVDHSEENIETSLVERVWDLYGRQELMSAIDKKLGEDFDKKQAESLLVVGLWCGHPDRNSRPSIKQAIQVLNLESPLPQLPPKMPSATFHISPSSSLLLSSSRVSVIQVGREQMMRDEEDLGGLCGSET